jgi:acyl transferase domain-containing protein
LDAPVDPRLEALAEQAWPPQGAKELDTTHFYDRLAEADANYGPVFQGLRRAWAVGDEIYAEIALEEEQHGEAADFLIHPALLDAALHAWAFRAWQGERSGGPQIPFSFAGVRLYGGGASSLRLCLGSEGVGSEMPTLSLLALDGEGQPLLAVDSLLLREIGQDALQGGRRKGHEALFELQWQEIASPSPNGSRLRVAALEDGEGIDLEVARIEELQCYSDLAALEDAVGRGAESPELVLVGAGAMVDPAVAEARAPELAGTELARGIHALTERTLSLLQAFLAAEALGEARLVLVTDGALAVAEEEAPNLTQAALVGLLRSAHAEHPERFSLVDIDQSSTSTEALRGALVSDEPELALRHGSLYAPRLGRLEVQEPSAAPEFDPSGTVLLIGGPGGFVGLLALHMVRAHGARHLLLASRSGEEAEGAEALREELEELGSEVRFVTCDASDRKALEGLITQVPAAHPLTAVVHTAAVPEDGVIESLDGERLRRVMRPKVDAAINLHELTMDLPLTELILFSSFAGIMGSARQGGYAAANTFLDAFAHHRRAQGLPAVSLAFGLEDSMTSGLSGAERARVLERFRRSEGLLPLSDEQGMELIDVARSVDRPLLVPVRLDTAALRSLARAGVLPVILRGLVRMPARRSGDAEGSLARRLAQEPESEWDAIVLELVKSHVADVLGHASSEAIDPTSGFMEQGLDSLGAVELRNRLNEATRLRLPAGVVLDYPTSGALANHIRQAVQESTNSQEAEPDTQHRNHADDESRAKKLLEEFGLDALTKAND